MSTLLLRQIDQIRSDLYAITDELEIIKMEPAQLPTRRELATSALGIILATMLLTTLSLLFFLR